jgi:hypothetical protein
MVGCGTTNPESRYQPVGRASHNDAKLMIEAAELVVKEVMKNIAERLRAKEKGMSSEKGPFLLFALMLREEAPDLWDLVVSAPWIESDKAKALAYIAVQGAQ